MKRALEGWDRFWFQPEPTSTLALVRIAFGALMVGWTISLLPDLFAFFSSDGVLPRRNLDLTHGVWGLLSVFRGDAVLVGLYIALLVASLCLMLGYRTRLAALVVFLGVMSLERRNPFVFNSGDGLIRILALFLMLAPAGASLSVDRLRAAKERFWEFPARAPWALRLIQLQSSVVYLSTVWQKLRGTTWNDGTAVSYALRIEDLQRLPVPAFLTDSLLAANLLTYATLATELALAVLVWSGKARPWVLGLGVAMHLLIDYAIRVGFFSLAVIVALIAFLPPDAVNLRLHAFAQRLGRSRPARLILRSPAAPQAPRAR